MQKSAVLIKLEKLLHLFYFYHILNDFYYILDDNIKLMSKLNALTLSEYFILVIFP